MGSTAPGSGMRSRGRAGRMRRFRVEPGDQPAAAMSAGASLAADSVAEVVPFAGGP